MRISLLFLCAIFLVLLFVINKPLFRKNPLAGPFPYKFKYEKKLGGTNFLFDLDNDGKEEFISLPIEEKGKLPSYVHVRNSDYVLANRVNLGGKIKRIFSLNWNENEDEEILLPYRSNDSLFLRIVDKNAKTLLNEKFLFAGKSIHDETGDHEWQGQIIKIIPANIDGKGENEILFFVDEPHAKRPRGVYVFNRNFEFLWKYEIGPKLTDNPLVYDINNDGFLEIILPTSAPDNGNIVNKTTDKKSYLLCLDHLGQLLWSREFGGIFSKLKIKLADIDGDGKDKLISLFSYYSNAKEHPYIEIIDPLKKGRALSPRRAFPLKAADFEIIHTDRNIEKEIIVTDNTGKILLLDNSFNILKSTNLNTSLGGLYVCEDLNNDGFAEIFIGGAEGTIWMDHKLSILAKTSLPLQVATLNVQLHHGESEFPLILFKDKKSEKLFSVKKAPFFLLAYYGPSLVIFLGFSLILGLITFSIIAKNQKNYWFKMFENYAATSKQSIFILDQKLYLLYANSAGRSFLKLTSKKLPYFLNKITGERKTFVNKISFLKGAEVKHYKQEFSVAKNRIIQLIAEPIQLANFPNPYWLILFQDSTEKELIEEAKARAALAQRIAHNIKNPLTSIQLSLQRLQMEYKERDKKNINNYDQFTNRIIERIEFLKRQTRDFMKFVNLEKLNLLPCNFNDIIENILSSSIVEIPGDITLIKKLSQKLPMIHLDQEQMQSVVENLITNSINAMPNGGNLTISTSLASDLQIPNGSEKKYDCIVLEIMDTGIGIPEKMREKIFLPFSTNTHLGTGLGLMIVKKIIDDHQGFIEVNSEEGVGTSFIIYLPVA